MLIGCVLVQRPRVKVCHHDRCVVFLVMWPVLWHRTLHETRIRRTFVAGKNPIMTICLCGVCGGQWHPFAIEHIPVRVLMLCKDFVDFFDPVINTWYRFRGFLCMPLRFLKFLPANGRQCTGKFMRRTFGVVVLCRGNAPMHHELVRRRVP